MVEAIPAEKRYLNQDIRKLMITNHIVYQDLAFKLGTKRFVIAKAVNSQLDQPKHDEIMSAIYDIIEERKVKWNG